MELNKGKAIGVKEIAEKKMQMNDFEGARNSALEVIKLIPQLENISQLLAVCDVHCSSQNKIYGNEKDWYKILQVDRLADEATIKKQYRKLALALHPDKNKFPGAEAAFKLIGEANMVLSDRGRRLCYDIKHRASVTTVIRKPKRCQANPDPAVKKSNGVQNRNPNISTYQFSSNNLHQPTNPNMFPNVAASWTYCPLCKGHYYRSPLSTINLCLKCYMSRNIGSQCTAPGSNQGNFGEGVNPGSSKVKAAVSQQEQVPVQNFKVGEHTTEKFSSDLGSEGAPGHTFDSEQVKQGGTSEISGGLKGKENCASNGVQPSKVDMNKARKSEASANKNKKRGRKSAVESSESWDTMSSSDSDVEVIFEETKGNTAASQASGQEGVNSRRISSRQRQKVSYNESVSDDDDFMSPQNRPGQKMDDSEEPKDILQKEKFQAGNADQVAPAGEVDEKDIKSKGSIPTAESSLYGNGEAGKHQVNVEEASPLDCGDKNSCDVDGIDSNSSSDCTPHPEFYECPDPEFHDFDNNKDEKCFAVGQVWACYATNDGMPRFYAQVRKAYLTGFKLRITWLEPNPEKQGEIDWVEEELPVGCGKFVRGDTEETSDRLMFSHCMHFEKSRGQSSYMIYPRKGEIWALFKNWDIGWSSEPECHKKHKFEIVEILSDFGHDTGIKVGFLEKIRGFVSLFQQTTQNRPSSILIPSGELLRFSHLIPSFKMTGSERADVPEGSFELDPASLPTDPNDI